MKLGAVVVVIDVQLLVYPVSITTKVVSLNFFYGEV